MDNNNVCSRGTALIATGLQLICIITVLMQYTDKRPLYTYTASVSYKDANSFMNNTFIRMYFPTYLYGSHIAPHSELVSQHPTTNVASNQIDHYTQADTLNIPFSTIQVTEINPFLLFVTGSVLCLFFTALTMSLLKDDNIQSGAPYGEHGLMDSCSWEFIFWVFVWHTHFTLFICMAAPADLVHAVSLSFIVSFFLASRCYLTCFQCIDNDHSKGVSRRFELPVLSGITLTGITFVMQTKVVLSTQFTYVIWLIYILLDAMLIFGHSWDNPVLTTTIVNCRWSYTLSVCFVNCILYAAL